MRVSLFVTCLADTLFPRVGRAVVTVLERQGQVVDFPAAQTCCGQMHANAGYQDEALELVRHFVTTFADAEAIVTPSSSCAAMIRSEYRRLAERSDDPGLVDAVDTLAPRIFELSEFLDRRLGIHDVGARFPHRVTYHPTCHSFRSLRVGETPLRLLRAVDGIQLLPLDDAETCCGFGGTFAVKNADTSAAMVGDKIREISRSGAAFCTAVDTSCLMHLDGALKRAGADVRVLHFAEILAAT